MCHMFYFVCSMKRAVIHNYPCFPWASPLRMKRFCKNKNMVVLNGPRFSWLRSNPLSFIVAQTVILDPWLLVVSTQATCPFRALPLRHLICRLYTVLSTYIMHVRSIGRFTRKFWTQTFHSFSVSSVFRDIGTGLNDLITNFNSASARRTFERLAWIWNCAVICYWISFNVESGFSSTQS